MIPDFRTFIGESTWGEMRKRAEGTSKKLEDAVRLEDRVYKERFDNCEKKFVESIVYFEKFNNTLNDFLKFIDEEVSHITWYEIRSNKGKIVKFSDIVIPYVKDNWDKIDNIKKQIDDLVSEEKIELSKMGFRKEPGKTIGDMIDTWWNTLDDYTRYEIMMDSSVFKSEEEEFYSTHMDDDEFTGEDLDPDDMYVNCPMRELTQIYMNNINKVTESTWGDMRKRAEGVEIRKEDELKLIDLGDHCDFYFADDDFRVGDKDEFTYDEMKSLTFPSGWRLPKSSEFENAVYRDNDDLNLRLHKNIKVIDEIPDRLIIRSKQTGDEACFELNGHDSVYYWCDDNRSWPSVELGWCPRNTDDYYVIGGGVKDGSFRIRLIKDK